jgi:hypothetical protein
MYKENKRIDRQERKKRLIEFPAEGGDVILAEAEDLETVDCEVSSESFTLDGGRA